MDGNPVPVDKIQKAQDDVRREQGGTMPEGTSTDPHSKHEAPCKESGHSSASGSKSY